MLFDPSSGEKKQFDEGVRLEMVVIGLTSFPNFKESEACLLKVKFVVPRRRMDLVHVQTVPYLAADTRPFPLGKDVDNLIKFVTHPHESAKFCRNLLTQWAHPGLVASGW
jgi:hypothetical protein